MSVEMPEPSKTVLVTGGAGYIGSHTCKALWKRGYEAVAFDCLETGHEKAVKWGPLERGNLLDSDSLVDAIARHSPFAVMHFAAYAYVGESVSDPARYYRNNLTGTINLLNAMLKQKVRNIVFSSTCATYGVPDSIPIPETSPQNPINPYGRSKWMIEQMLADYSRAYDVSCCSLRYFNAAGADPDGEIGETHDPEPHLIPNVLRTGMGKGGELKVFGNDYPTRDGTCIRDYIHVTDLTEAHCLALDHLVERPGVHAFNLGSNRGHSVLEVIEAAEVEIGVSIPYTVEKRRSGDPPVLVADSSRAERELGWTRVHSSLREILRTAWKWEQSGGFLA